MSSPQPSETELPAAVRGHLHQFLDTYEPLRAPLYRYCRHLTRSPWDAEELAQDALLRAFATLGQLGEAPANPRAWLFRVASNLWIDRVRRRAPEQPLAEPIASAVSSDPRASREAAGTLLSRLSPQERAALVLKDAFELSLEEVAEVLSTSVGAVKHALHRARGKLQEQDELAPPVGPAPGVLDAFCQAFNAGDVDRLAALLLDSAAVEVVGATTQYGPEAARRTILPGMLFGARRMATADVNGGIEARFMLGILPALPRVEARQHRGEWLVLHWYQHQDGQFVRAITRIEADGDRVARLQNYFFTPDFLAELCTELGVPFRLNGHRWWIAGCST